LARLRASAIRAGSLRRVFSGQADLKKIPGDDRAGELSNTGGWRAVNRVTRPEGPGAEELMGCSSTRPVKVRRPANTNDGRSSTNTPSETTSIAPSGIPSIRSSNRWKIIIIVTKSGSCSIRSIGVVFMQPCASYHHRVSLLSRREFSAPRTRNRIEMPYLQVRLRCCV